MNEQQHWQGFITAFNEERFVDGVLQLEELWFPTRNDLYRGLIRLSVALNQLRLGIVDSPRQLLASAHEMLAPFETNQHNLDIQRIREYIQVCASLIPADLHTGQGRIDWEQVPRIQL